MKIKFSCEKHLLGVIPDPVPSIRKIPNYFKSVKPQSSPHPQDGTVKRCVPFLDALSAGYILQMWCDVHVFASNGEIQIDFPRNFMQKETLGQHGIQQIPGHPLAKKPYGNIPLKWINPWLIKTDPGVSCLFTSPLNHLETRFKILDGVVDTDTYYNNVNFPFIWTGGDGNFFIEKGTPIVQVIPFRREEFDLEVSVIDSEEKERTVSVLGTKLKNAYREEFWHKAKKNHADENEVSWEQEDDKQVKDADVYLPEKLPEDPALDHSISEDVKVEDLTSPSEWKNNLSSGILEVVADDKGRGFGEGGF